MAFKQSNTKPNFLDMGQVAVFLKISNIKKKVKIKLCSDFRKFRRFDLPSSSSGALIASFHLKEEKKIIKIS